MQHPASNHPTPSWIAQVVLTELHAQDRGLTAVNLAGRTFLPLRQVNDALHELHEKRLVRHRGRRWRARERRNGEPEPTPGRRRDRRRDADGPRGSHAA